MREAYRDVCARSKKESDRTIAKVKSVPAAQPQPQEDPKDAQLASLREELARVKAALTGTTHQPTAGGDAPASAKTHGKSVQYDTSVTTDVDTDVQLRNHLSGRRPGKAVTQSEYTTCAEEHPAEYISADGRVYHRRRKSKAERRSLSRPNNI